MLRLLAFQLVLLVLSKIQSLDFDDEVLVILVFFPDWCPHCQGCAVSQQPGHVPQVIVDGVNDGGGDCDGDVPQAMVNYDRSVHRGCCWLCCCPLGF